MINSNLSVFYSVYEYDKNGNKQLICGARSQQIAEAMLKLHPGYEDKTVVWGKEVIYVSHFQPTIKEGIVQ